MSIERIDWAAEYTYTDGRVGYAYCDTREFAEQVRIFAEAEVIGKKPEIGVKSVRVVTRMTVEQAYGERTSTEWVAA